jgi:uncharacterized membrane protein YeaQ/YmgE (transglycosylase-associated protein family)
LGLIAGFIASKIVNSQEWTKVLESTMSAGMAVSAAEPSGLWGTLKEAFASSSALAAAKLDPGSSELGGCC